MMYSPIELDDHIDETKLLIEMIIMYMASMCTNRDQILLAYQDLWYYENKLRKLKEQKT